MCKLRNMSASVSKQNDVTLVLESGEIVTLPNAYVLTSYSSRVAVYDGKATVYLLPRYDYSVTTWKHVHAFVCDYWAPAYDYDANTIRQIASGKLGGDEYVFARGFYAPGSMVRVPYDGFRETDVIPY